MTEQPLARMYCMNVLHGVYLGVIPQAEPLRDILEWLLVAMAKLDFEGTLQVSLDKWSGMASQPVPRSPNKRTGGLIGPLIVSMGTSMFLVRQ